MKTKEEILKELENKVTESGRSIITADTYTCAAMIDLDDVVDLLYEMQINLLGLHNVSKTK